MSSTRPFIGYLFVCAAMGCFQGAAGFPFAWGAPVFTSWLFVLGLIFMAVAIADSWLQSRA